MPPAAAADSPSPGPLQALTLRCIARPRLVVAVWVAALAAGAAGALGLGGLLVSGFTLPGTDSARVSQLLATRFDDTSKGDFVLIASGPHPARAARIAAAETVRIVRGSRRVGIEALPSGRAAALVRTPLSGDRRSA